MRFFKSKFINLLGLVLLGLAGLFLVASTFKGPQPKVKVTVFVHGTVGCSLNIFNPTQCKSENFDDQLLSARLVKKYRNHELMCYDQILGAEGLHEISSATLPQWHAAHHLIPAYDEVAGCIDAKADIQKYLIFGWSGFLNHGARRKAGFELYNSLADYCDQIRYTYGVDPELDLITHSHGGNVALWLAEAEKECKRNLKIDVLVMFGTPMQTEMACAIQSDVFRTMVMIYSRGDSVQQRDYFSTKGKSYRRMVDIADLAQLKQEKPHLYRCDLACIVNKDRKRITHTNMWMSGRSNSVFYWMEPVPLMVITPVILQILQHNPCPIHAEIYLSDKNDGCLVMINEFSGDKYYDTHVLRSTLVAWAQHMRDGWQLSQDKSHHPFFNRKNWDVFKQIVWA